MSSVPPNLVGPILQGHLAQRQASNIRDNEQAQRVSADKRQNNNIDEQDTTVDTTDNDTQIYPDAQGSGSQGRAFSQPEEQEQEQGQESNEQLTEGEEGRHLDLEA